MHKLDLQVLEDASLVPVCQMSKEIVNAEQKRYKKME